jgi:tRNA threonylcarbamoyladenosine biosynthesis protein TsaE
LIIDADGNNNHRDPGGRMKDLVFTALSHSPADTKRIGQSLGRLVRPGDVILVRGEMGSGKTTFIQGLAEGLGISVPVTSPTFTLIHEYPGRLPLYHVDAYRLEKASEIDGLGLEEYFYGTGVTAVEWPENIARWLPDDYLEIHLTRTGDLAEGRRLVISQQGSGIYGRLLEELKTSCECSE